MRPQHSILMVEDDPFDVGSVQRAFSVHKLKNPLRVVGDGVEALEYLRNEGEFADAAEFPRPSLILLDLKMPRMGGLEFLEQIKSDRELSAIPIVVLTSSAEEGDIVQSYRNGASSYIVKPLTFEKLVEAIRVFDLYWTLSEIP
jgi:two-component system response regulator